VTSDLQEGFLLTQMFVILFEQIAGFYRGVTAPLAAVTPYFAVTFLGYDYITGHMRTYNLEKTGSEKLSIVQCGIAGSLTAFPCATFVAPSERIKCILQVQNNTGAGVKYNGSWDCARKLYNLGGIRSIYKGLGITILRDAPGNGVYFFTNELFRTMFAKGLGYEDTKVLPTSCILLSGGFAGVGNWIVAIPADVVKSRFQTAPEGMYNSSRDVLKEILAKEGWKTLFRGLTPSLMRAFPSNAAAFFGVDLAQKTLVDLGYR